MCAGLCYSSIKQASTDRRTHAQQHEKCKGSRTAGRAESQVEERNYTDVNHAKSFPGESLQEATSNNARQSDPICPNLTQSVMQTCRSRCLLRPLSSRHFSTCAAGSKQARRTRFKAQMHQCRIRDCYPNPTSKSFTQVRCMASAKDCCQSKAHMPAGLLKRRLLAPSRLNQGTTPVLLSHNYPPLLFLQPPFPTPHPDARLNVPFRIAICLAADATSCSKQSVPQQKEL
eukprot:6194141-Pleurochrysis_carterae.AAC.3